MDVPFEDAKAIAETRDCSQVIVVAWDGVHTHVATYGKSIEDSDQAAMGGDLVKKALGWPETLMGALPSRVADLKAKLAQSGNYVADSEVDPTCVWFANGRKVSLETEVKKGRIVRAWLEVGMSETLSLQSVENIEIA